MLNKDPDKDGVEIGGIIKKVILGGAFLLLLPIVVPAITGVDIVQGCVIDPAKTGSVGAARCKVVATDDAGAAKLQKGFDQLKPVLVVVLDIFFVIIGLAILFGPGKTLISYKFVLRNAITH